MFNELAFIHEKLLFTKQEFSQFLGKTTSASMTLHNYMKRGLIANVRRNLYCACDLATKSPVPEKMQIASALSETACVGYHSALEYHGLCHQVFYSVYVQSKNRFNDVDFNGIQYHYCKQTHSCGIVNPTYNNMVRVTDLERTLIDCCDRVDFAGGIEELLHCLESRPLLSEQKLLEYLRIFNKDILYKKCGYIMELAGMKLSPNFFTTCLEHSRNSVSYLENKSDNMFVSKWRLYVPQYISHIKEEVQDELI